MTHIVVVTGPPCSGKSTYIDQHRDEQDIVIDLDRIAHAIGYPTQQLDYNDPHPARHHALRARASILKSLTERTSTAPRAWVIDTNGNTTGHEQINLDPGPDECHRRADQDNRPASTHQHIDEWYTPRARSRSW